MSNWKAVGENVIVTRIEAKKETSSGIILKSSEEPDRAKVESIGESVLEGEFYVGDELLVNWNAATKVHDETYVIPYDQIIWVFE